MMVAIYRNSWMKKRWSEKFKAVESDEIPWTPLQKPLSQCKIALITTGGVHLKDDLPFNMEDKNGDPTYRKIPSVAQQKDLSITHNYYNHVDADQDINLIFPLDVLRDIQIENLVGEIADVCYSFMGHIDKQHLNTLVEETSIEVAKNMKKEKVDIALLVPA